MLYLCSSVCLSTELEQMERGNKVQIVLLPSSFRKSFIFEPLCSFTLNLSGYLSACLLPTLKYSETLWLNGFLDQERHPPWSSAWRTLQIVDPYRDYTQYFSCMAGISALLGCRLSTKSCPFFRRDQRELQIRLRD